MCRQLHNRRGLKGAEAVSISQKSLGKFHSNMRALKHVSKLISKFRGGGLKNLFISNLSNLLWFFQIIIIAYDMLSNWR